MGTSERTFRKHRPDAPEGYFAAEAAGLRWLAEAEADGGARVVRVVSVGAGFLELDREEDARPSAADAEEFGAALARTHDAGAAWFGARPDGWSGPCYLGRQELPVTDEPLPWGRFYAQLRVLPYLERAVRRGHVDDGQADVVRSACARIAAGDFDDDDGPARLHGDLWNGNVLWTPRGAVLIDPAAHGGHRETDLAMLALFGAPRLEAVLAGYLSVHPLADGWRDRVPLHQLHPLAVHAASHGASYAAPLVSAARSALAL